MVEGVCVWGASHTSCHGATGGIDVEMDGLFRVISFEEEELGDN